MSVAKDLARLIVEGSQNKTSPYDTTGTVKRVEGDTAYVVFDENDTETPVDLSIACEKGDKVVVRVSGNRARLTGNMTAPPTDDKVAKEAKAATGTLMKAVKATQASVEALAKEVEDSGSEVESVVIEYILSTSNAELIPYDDMEWSEELPEYVPGCYYWTRTATHLQDGEVKYSDPVPDLHAQLTAELQQAVNSEGNYFWYDTSGAYVTKTPKEAYQSNPTGYATRWTGEGILQYYDSSLLTSWTGSGVSFYRTGSNTPLASFGTGGILFDPSLPFTVGNASSYIKWVNDNGTWKIKIAADAIEMGGSDVLVDGDACQWYSGTGVYGTSTSPTIFSGSGVADAKVGDMYLNTTYSRTYRCTVAGAPSTARWVYVNSIKGADGQDGADGIDVTSQYMSFDTTNGLRVYSGYKGNSAYNKAYTQIQGTGMTLYRNVNGTATKVAFFGSYIELGFDSLGRCMLRIEDDEDEGAKFTTGLKPSEEPFFTFEGNVEATRKLLGYDVQGDTMLCDGDFYWNNAKNRTTSSAANVRVGDAGRFYQHTSARRNKSDIEDLQDQYIAPEKLYDVRVAQFRYRDGLLEDSDQRIGKLVPGFIADEIAEAYPVAVDIGKDGDPIDWDVSYIVPPMLALIQQHKKEIDTLKKQISQLTA